VSVGTETGPSTAWPAWDDPAFYDQEPDAIHASMAAQRRGAPIHWYEPGQFWVLSKREHQRFVSSHPELFSSRHGFLIGDAGDPEAVMSQMPPWAREQLAQPGLSAAEKRGLVARAKLSMGDPAVENLIYLDPPRHNEVRSIFMQAVRPSLVRKLGPLAAQLTDDAIAGIEPGAVTDFVAAVAAPVPAGLMADLIGVPREMWPQFGEWAAALLASSTITPDRDPAEAARLQELTAMFLAYVDELMDERRATASDGDDLVSAVIRSEIDGSPITRAMGLMYVVSLIGGGSDTSKHLMAFLAQALAERPDQLEILRTHPELIPNAVEETLRYYPIVWSECRTALERVVLDGHVIEKDDFVVMSYSSANRDDDVWERPDEFDVTRSFDNRHMAFGWGQHACPGAMLTRVDVRAVFERLLASFSGWSPAASPVRLTSPFMNGLISLPLEFRT
jgi:cytochrome P450